jgi:hypothetical protein
MPKQVGRVTGLGVSLQAARLVVQKSCKENVYYILATF